MIMSFLKGLFKRTPQTETYIAEIEPIFKLYNDKIYPWVKVTFINDDAEDPSPHIELTDDESPIMKSWLGDLTIFYVADNGNYFQMLLERDLPSDISKEQLHELAITNLQRDIQFKIQETKFGAYGLLAGGDHEAGSICLPTIWNSLSEYFNDNLIVAIPSKDLVMMVPENDLDKIADLKISVHEVFKSCERLLTRNIFRFDKELLEWTIFDSVK